MEERSNILHELVEVEVDADGALEHLQGVLLEKQVVTAPLGDLWVASRYAGRRRQSLHSLNDQVAREVTAHEADHLMVVQRGHRLVVRCRMEHFLDLLEERLSVELRGGDEGVLAE